MNKESGATLIEIIGVILVLVALLLIVLPTVNSIINFGKQKTYDANVEAFEEAGKGFLAMYNINQNGSKIYLNDLINEKYIPPIISPWTGKECDRDNSFILLTKNNGEIIYTSLLLCENDTN